jgi:hypothetical protein
MDRSAGGTMMVEAELSGLIGSWKLVSVQFRMSDNGEIIDEPIGGSCTFDCNGRWTVVAIPSDVCAYNRPGTCYDLQSNHCVFGAMQV